MRKKLLEYKHFLVLGIWLTLVSCSSYDNPNDLKEDVTNEQIFSEKRYIFQRGVYYFNCTVNSNKVISLKIQGDTAILSTKHKLIAHGVLALDTLDYNMEDSVYSFATGKFKYAFTRQDVGEVEGLLLYNEDYKQPIEFCSDSKSLLFLRTVP